MLIHHRATLFIAGYWHCLQFIRSIQSLLFSLNYLNNCRTDWQETLYRYFMIMKTFFFLLVNEMSQQLDGLTWNLIDIDILLWMNYNNFSDSFTFHLAWSSGQESCISPILDTCIPISLSCKNYEGEHGSLKGYSRITQRMIDGPSIFKLWCRVAIGNGIFNMHKMCCVVLSWDHLKMFEGTNIYTAHFTPSIQTVRRLKSK